MKKRFLLVITSIILMIMATSIVQASDGRLFLDVDFVGNWIFDIYDVDVYIDNVKIESLPHGTDFSKLIRNVTEGEHILSFRSADNSDVCGEYKVDFHGDTTFQCSLYCHESNIKLDSVKIIDNVDLAEIEVPDLSEVILSAAEKTLKDTGFVNIKSRAENDSIWDSDHWIVLSQDPEGGTVADKNREIILTCTHTDEYLKKFFENETLLDVSSNAERLGFEIHFVNAITDSNMDSRVAKMSEEEKSQWKVTGIEADSYGSREADLEMIYYGEKDIPDLIGLKLSEALQRLKNEDFSSVDYESDSGESIWDNDNWYVIKQSVDAGKAVPANQKIDLVVRHKDDIEEDKAAGIDSFSGYENTDANDAELEDDKQNEPENGTAAETQDNLNVETEKEQNDENKTEQAKTLGESEEKAAETIEEENFDSNDEEEIITVDNNAEFARIMTRYDYWSDEVENFANKYKGRMIAFPGHCMDVFSESGDESHVNIGMTAGDYIQGVDVYGPAFLCRGTTIKEFIGNVENPPSTISVGDNLYFTGIIDHYENDLELFILRPVSASKRDVFDYSGAEIVKSVQEALNGAGYDCGEPDGVAGNNTKNAISKFREDNSLLSGDYIDWALVTALNINTGTSLSVPEETVTESEKANSQTSNVSEEETTSQFSGSNGIELFRSKIEPIVQQSFGSDYFIDVEEKTVTIAVWTEGMTECILLASEGDQEMMETYQSIKSSCDEMADFLYSALLDYDKDAHLMYCIMNEYNLENILFAYMDGDEIA